MKFSSDPSNREFDVVSDKYIGQTNEGTQTISKHWRDATKATFEAAKETGKTPYFHFENQPTDDILRRLEDYGTRYDIEYVLDISPL